MSLSCCRFFRRSLFAAFMVVRLRSWFATPIRDIRKRTRNRQSWRRLAMQSFKFPWLSKFLPLLTQNIPAYDFYYFLCKSWHFPDWIFYPLKTQNCASLWRPPTPTRPDHNFQFHLQIIQFLNFFGHLPLFKNVYPLNLFEYSSKTPRKCPLPTLGSKCYTFFEDHDTSQDF